MVSNTNNIQLKFNEFKFEEANEHINKMPFSGVCMFTEKPSDGTPSGSDKPVLFTREATEKALESFVGMGVNCEYSYWDTPDMALTGHDLRFKIGVVDEAFINTDGNVEIKGHLWKKDFYDVCFMIKNAKDSLGFSIEVSIQSMEDVGENYQVNDFVFTGVAILYKNLAAFKGTELAAQRKKEDDNKMNNEQFTQFMAVMQGLNNKIEDLGAKVNALAEKEPVKVDFKEVVDAIKANAPMAATGKPEGVVEKPAAPAPEVPVPQAQQFEAKGSQTQETKRTYEMMCQEVDNDASIPLDRKAHEKVKRYYAEFVAK